MEILDSGERRIFENGFQRDMSEGKGRFDLLPWNAIWDLSKHCEDGARKYGERNIDKGCPQNSLIDSAIRHLVKYQLGWEDEPHLRAALWNVAWALEQEATHPEMLNLPFQIAKRKALEEADDKADREKAIAESGERLSFIKRLFKRRKKQ